MTPLGKRPAGALAIALDQPATVMRKVVARASNALIRLK
jgi:hypothetical protein